MTVFRYRAVDAHGRVVRGESRADNESELEGRLARVDLELLAAIEAKGSFIDSWRRTRLSPAELINLFVQMESLLRAGVPLLDVLADLRESAVSPSARRIAADMLDRIETGSTLSDAMAAQPAIFNTLVVGLVRTGEVTGKLPDVLAEIITSLKWQDDLSSRTRKALRYPMFVAIVLAAVIVFLMVYLVPQLATFLSGIGKEMPLQTRALVWLSNLVVRWWPLLLFGPVLLFVGSRMALARSAPLRLWRDDRLLHLPVVGEVLRKVCLARFSNTFALMFGAGIPVLDALAHCEQAVGNLAIGDSVARSRTLVSQGAAVSEAFAVLDVFPSYVVRMVRVGEMTGRLDTSLRNVSHTFMREVSEQLDRLQSLIEPVLTLVMGLILAWVLLAVLGPVYDSISTMQG
jgi:type IV pilus assembly protein PilC